MSENLGYRDLERELGTEGEWTLLGPGGKR